MSVDGDSAPADDDPEPDRQQTTSQHNQNEQKDFLLNVSDLHDHEEDALHDLCFAADLGDVFSAFNDATEYVQLAGYDDENLHHHHQQQQQQPDLSTLLQHVVPLDEANTHPVTTTTTTALLQKHDQPSIQPQQPVPENPPTQSSLPQASAAQTPKRPRSRQTVSAQPILPRASTTTPPAKRKHPSQTPTPPLPPTDQSQKQPQQQYPFEPVSNTKPPLLPMINMGASMYPLQQHNHPVFPSAAAAAAAAIKIGDRATRQDNPGSSSDSANNKKIRLEDPKSSTATTATTAATPTPLMTPHAYIPPHPQALPLLPGVLPLDTTAAVMPFLVSPQFSHFFAQVANAAYQHRPVMSFAQPHPNMSPAPVAPTPPVIPPFQPYPKTPADSGATTPPGLHRTSAVSESLQSAAPDASAPPTKNPSVAEDGSQKVLAQQAPARLEPHPVLGRLQLRNLTNATAQSNNPVTITDTTTGGVADSSPKERNRSEHSAQPQSGPASQVVSSSEGNRAHARPQKKRLVWTPELHERFVQAIDRVGLDHAFPKTLVNFMNVEGLTTDHVKSHLQKYRSSLRKEAAEDARERNRQGGAGPAGIHATGSAIGQLAATGALRARGTSIGLGTSERSVQQLQVLPGRINLYGTPLPSVATSKGKVGAPAAARQTQVRSPTTPRAGVRPGGGRHCSDSTLSLRGSGRGEVGISGRGSEASKRKQETNIRGRQSGVGVSVGGFNEENGTNAVTRMVALGGVAGVGVGMGSSAQEMMQVGAMQALSQQQKEGQRTGRRDGEGEGGEAKDGLMEDSSRKRSREKWSGGSSRLWEAGSSGRSEEGKETRLEVLDERYLQMQLQLQVWVHRMIALEKKMQQYQSELEPDSRDGGSGSGCGGDGSRVDGKVERKEGEGNDGEEALRQTKSEINRKSQELEELVREQLEMSRHVEEHRAVIGRMMEKGRGGESSGGDVVVDGNVQRTEQTDVEMKDDGAVAAEGMKKGGEDEMG